MTEDELLRLAIVQEGEHALILLDAEGRVVAWLGASASLFGYESSETLGRTLDFLFVPEDRERGEPALELAIARSAGKAEDDRWSLRKDGSRFWANGAMTALRDTSGAIVGFSKVLRDRTDNKAEIDTLRQRADALASVKHRRDLVLATLAHELRNPLSVLVNAARVLSIGAPDAETIATGVRLIERQVESIKRLVEDLFDMASMAQGKARLDARDESLRVIVDTAIETCSPEIGKRGQDVQVLFPAGGIRLQADAVRLRQALVNLLGNASKFSANGGRIWIKATVEGEQAVLRVEDQGRGIPKELLPEIFDLFTQAAPTDTTLPPGLGLGLPLVKSIVELHGGTVHARSDGPARGAEFILRLPLSRPSLAANQPDIERKAKRESQDPPRQQPG